MQQDFKDGEVPSDVRVQGAAPVPSGWHGWARREKAQAGEVNRSQRWPTCGLLCFMSGGGSGEDFGMGPCNKKTSFVCHS